MSRVPTTDREAYLLYLKGRATTEVGPRRILGALDLFRQALDRTRSTRPPGRASRLRGTYSAIRGIARPRDVFRAARESPPGRLDN